MAKWCFFWAGPRKLWLCDCCNVSTILLEEILQGKYSHFSYDSPVIFWIIASHFGIFLSLLLLNSQRFNRYLSHTLFHLYAIPSIRYSIHLVFHPFGSSSIRYPLHSPSHSFPNQFCGYLILSSFWHSTTHCSTPISSPHPLQWLYCTVYGWNLRLNSNHTNDIA